MGGKEGEGTGCVHVCVYARMCMRNEGDQRGRSGGGGGCYERTISLPAGRIALRHAPHTGSISILGKSTLSEYRERGRESGGRIEAAGSRWTYAREGGNAPAERTEERKEKTGAVFTKGHVAVSPPLFFFQLYRDFSIFPPRSHRAQLSAEDFRGILLAAGNRRGDDPLNRIRLIYSDTLSENSSLRIAEELAVSAIQFLAVAMLPIE